MIFCGLYSELNMYVYLDSLLCISDLLYPRVSAANLLKGSRAHYLPNFACHGKPYNSWYPDDLMKLDSCKDYVLVILP